MSSQANQSSIHIALPEWLSEFEAELAESYQTAEERMALVIELSRRNVVEGSGGPFGAAVFERESGRLIAPGVNLVVAANTSVAHAESVAFMLAGQRRSCFDLGAAGMPATELVASAQPCIQCFGNVWWSGVSSLVIGARSTDVETIAGFKEGPVPDDWVELLEERGAPLQPIEVRRDVLLEQACEVLELYRDSGGLVYNAGSAGARMP